MTEHRDSGLLDENGIKELESMHSQQLIAALSSLPGGVTGPIATGIVNDIVFDLAAADNPQDASDLLDAFGAELNK